MRFPNCNRLVCYAGRPPNAYVDTLRLPRRVLTEAQAAGSVWGERLSHVRLVRSQTVYELGSAGQVAFTFDITRFSSTDDEESRSTQSRKSIRRALERVHKQDLKQWHISPTSRSRRNTNTCPASAAITRKVTTWLSIVIQSG